MNITDLDIAGFAEFFKKSTSHIYGILNHTRPLSEVFATEIGEKLNFDGTKIFNLNTRIPSSISKSDMLIKFKADHKHNPEYFLSSKSDRSANTFVTEILTKSDCFADGYKYLKEIKQYCKAELNREFIEDQLTKALQYAVRTNKLKSTKKPIKLKNGKFGTREVDVYFL
ncbi:hypothetical protein [Sphingobacterium pedocola]|nr:hypothetical protein [Sphingobacterium pedocola]